MMFFSAFRCTPSFNLRGLLSVAILVIGTCSVLTGCDYAKNQLKMDRSGNNEFQDYRDALAPRLPEVEDEEEKAARNALSIPQLQPYVASMSDDVQTMPLVSISVNQSVPLRDLLFEVAQQADYDLELDPRIRGSIIFTARERPLDQVIERISDIAGLRYSFDDSVLRVELDTPYNKSYKIDYLSFVRSNSSKISNNVAVVSGDGADTGSSFNSTSSSEIDFWAELEANLSQLLGGAMGNLRTNVDPQVTAMEQNPTVVPVAAPDENGNVTVSPPNVSLNVQQLPSGSEGAGYEAPEASFAINKQAGIIQVYAPEKAQKEIAEYLNLLRRSVTSQVLIEAKILEVTLRDRYATGIDWRAVDLLSGDAILGYASTTGAGLFAAADAVGNPQGVLGSASNITTLADPDGNTIGSSGFVAGVIGNDFQTLIKAISGFGTVKALASPRLTVLNNQSAVLNVATNRVFFEIDIESNAVEGGGVETDIDSTIRNVPEGVLLNVQPSINLDNGTIALSVRPTVTSVAGTVNDPGVAFAVSSVPAAAGITSPIPELNVQEIDSVIKLRSGHAAVMGGLLQDKTEAAEDGIPGLSEVPMLGGLFKQKADEITKTELVIFLRATILDQPEDSVYDADRDLYRAFSGDRRPLKL